MLNAKFSYKKHFIIFLGYFLFACLFFYPVFQNKASIFIDQLLHIGPMYTYWKTEILNGHLPLWNTQSLAGMPFFADPAHPVFSPFNLFFLLIPNIFSAIAYQVILYISLSAWGAYFLGRSLKISTWGSVVVGLVYGFSGSVFEVAATDLNSVIGVMLIPWVLAIYVEDFVNHNRLVSPRLALVLGLQLISAHTQYAYYASAIFLAHFGMVLISQIRDIKLPTGSYQLILAGSQESLQDDVKSVLARLGGMGWTLLLALLIGCIQFLPSYELIQQTQRQQNIGYENLRGIEFAEAPRLFFAKIYGSIVEGNSWGPGSDPETGYANVNGYISMVALVLIGLGLFYRRINRKMVFIGIVSGIAFILAFGNSTPLFKLFYEFVPGFSYFRSTSRILIVYSLGGALLAGLWLDQLKKVPLIQLRVVIISVLGSAVLLWLVHLLNPALLSTLFINLYETIKQTSFTEAQAYSLPKVQEISDLMLQALAIALLGIGAGLLLIKGKLSDSKSLFGFGLALMTIELFLTVRGDLFFVDIQKIRAEPEVIQYLQTRLNHDYRMISTGDTQPYIGFWNYFNHLIVRPPFSVNQITDSELKTWNTLTQELNMIPANTNQLYGLSSAASYVAIMPKRYRDYWESNRVNSLDFRDFQNPKLDDFAVKYFVTGYPNDVMNATSSSKFKPVFSTAHTRVYENTAVQPITQFLVADQPVVAALKRIDHSNSQIEIELTAPQNGIVVLRELYYPGWTARLDQQPVAITPYQGIFRQISIPTGRHQLTLRYQPNSLYLGAVLTGLGLLAMGLTAKIQRKRLYS